MPPGNSGNCSTMRKLSGLSPISTAAAFGSSFLWPCLSVGCTSSSSPTMRISVMVFSFSISLRSSTTFTRSVAFGCWWASIAATISSRSFFGRCSISSRKSSRSLSDTSLLALHVTSSKRATKSNAGKKSPIKNQSGRLRSRSAFFDFFCSNLVEWCYDKICIICSVGALETSAPPKICLVGAAETAAPPEICKVTFFI